MKKYLILFIAVVSSSFFVGCESDDEFTPPNYVTFADVTMVSDEVSVSVNEDASESVDLTVFTGNTTGSDRTFNVIVHEDSTLDPSAYSIPSTVTIPANSNEGTVTIDITGSGIDDAGDVLVLQLEGGNGVYVGEPLSIDILKVCDFDASQWIGTYDVSEVFTSGNNAGLSLAAAFGESYEIALSDNNGDTGSLVISNTAGSDQFLPNGSILTFGACAGNVILSSNDIAAGFGALTVTSSSFNEDTMTITVGGTLGAYGPYQFVLTKQSGDTDGGDGTDGGDTDGGDGEGDGTDE